MLLLERVGDVLEEDQPEDDVLVLRRVHVVAQRVGGSPELGLEAEIRPVAVALFLRAFGSHRTSVSREVPTAGYAARGAGCDWK